MKILIGLMGLMAANCAFADQPTTAQPQPCDPSWDACAIGRVDPLPATSDAKGRFLIDILFANPGEITANTPMIGAGKLGDVDDSNPYVQVDVAPGGVDVMLEVGLQPGSTQSFAIGKISAPIGTDVTTYYTREIHLNPGVRITEGPTQTTEKKYCDPGGVFGAEIYNQELSDTTYVITGATPAPFSYHVQRMIIKSNYPAIFGCGN